MKIILKRVVLYFLRRKKSGFLFFIYLFFLRKFSSNNVELRHVPHEVTSDTYSDVIVVAGIRFFLQNGKLFSLASNVNRPFAEVYKDYYLNEEINAGYLFFHQGAIYGKSMHRKLSVLPGNTVIVSSPVQNNFGHYINESLQHLVYAYRHGIAVHNVIVDAKAKKLIKLTKILCPKARIICLKPLESIQAAKLIIEPNPNFIVGWLRDGGFRELYSLNKGYYSSLNDFFSCSIESKLVFKIYKSLFLSVGHIPKNLYFMRDSNIRKLVNIVEVIHRFKSVMVFIFPEKSIYLTYILSNYSEVIFCQGGSAMYNILLARDKKFCVAVDQSSNMSCDHLLNDFKELGHEVHLLELEVLENQDNDHMIRAVHKDLKVSLNEFYNYLSH